MKKVIFIAAMVFALNFSSKANENESKPLNGNTYEMTRMEECCDGTPPRYITVGMKVVTKDECGNIIKTEYFYNGKNCVNTLIQQP